MTTIDFQVVAEVSPLRYRVVCSDHGEVATDVDARDATQAASLHDGREHRGETDWLYRSESILDSFGEPSSTASPAAKAVEVKRASRKPATDAMFPNVETSS